MFKYIPLLFSSCFFMLTIIKGERLDNQSEPRDLQIEVMDKPKDCGYFAIIGDMVHVEYIGVVKKHRHKFDLKEGKSPLKFLLGSGSQIKGLEKGVEGMCVGEHRKLVVPPDFAYGRNGLKGSIPPDATLLFHVHLVTLDRQTRRKKKKKKSGKEL